MISQTVKKQYKKYATHLILFFSITLIAIVDIVTSSQRSFWLDEIFSVNVSKNWGTLWNTLAQYEPNMWFYYLLLHFWLQFGKTELFVRSLSIIFACVTVIAVYFLGTLLFTKAVGRLAALLLSVNIFFITYSQDARSYSLLVLLTTLSSYFFIKSMYYGKKNYWLLYVVITALSIYTQLYAVFILIAQVVSAPFLIAPHVRLKYFFVSQGVIYMLLSPFLILPSVKNQLAEIVPRYNDILSILTVLSGDLSILSLILVAIVLGNIFILFQKGHHKELYPIIFLLTCITLPISISFVFSFFVKPIISQRYLIVCLVPFTLVLANSVLTLRSKKVFLSLFFLIMIFSCIRIFLWSLHIDEFSKLDINNEPWRQTVSYSLSQGTSEKIAVLFYPYFLKIPYDYYLYDTPHRPITIKTIEISSGSYLKNGAGTLPEPNILVLNSLSNRFDVVLFITENIQLRTGNRYKEMQKIQNQLGKEYRLSSLVSFGQISVWRYDINRVMVSLIK